MAGSIIIANCIGGLLTLGAAGILAVLMLESRERKRLTLAIGVTVILCLSVGILLLQPQH